VGNERGPDLFLDKSGPLFFFGPLFLSNLFHGLLSSFLLVFLFVFFVNLFFSFLLVFPSTFIAHYNSPLNVDCESLTSWIAAGTTIE
jgi:hypothetical protein